MQQTLDLPYEVARLYASHGNYALIAFEMEQKTGRIWSVTQVKRQLIVYLREQTGFEDRPNRLLRRPHMHFPGRPSRY